MNKKEFISLITYKFFQAVDKVVEFFIKSTTSFYFLCKLINLYYFPYMSFFFVR